MINNIIALTKTAKLFDMPIALTTVAVEAGYNLDKIKQIRDIIPDVKSIHRLTVNPWEDEEFHQEVASTGRKKLIMCGLWTEVCMAFPVIDALKKGLRCTLCPTQSASPTATRTSGRSRG